MTPVKRSNLGPTSGSIYSVASSNRFDTVLVQTDTTKRAGNVFGWFVTETTFMKEWCSDVGNRTKKSVSKALSSERIPRPTNSNQIVRKTSGRYTVRLTRTTTFSGLRRESPNFLSFSLVRLCDVTIFHRGFTAPSRLVTLRTVYLTSLDSTVVQQY